MEATQRAKYELVPYSRLRQVNADFLHLAHGKHTVHGLVEVDVTRPRRLLSEHKARSGESLSFTGWIIACVGRAVEEHKMVHAYRDWRSRLVLFDEVDASIIVEIEDEGGTFPLAHVLRAVNRRTFRDIHDEIRRVQARPKSSSGMERWRWLPVFLVLPAWVRHLVFRALFRMPRLVKEMIGTVVVSSVGMFGAGSGWVIPLTSYSLGVSVGGIAPRTAVVDGQIETREWLCLTVSLDHDVVDGGPAARFTRCLKELLEGGYGLDDLT